MIGGSLESALMFWETWCWALATGSFSQPRRQVLGNHRDENQHEPLECCRPPPPRNLVVKGALFMVASTNLVIEICLVLIALMGWQFAVAEFVGGPIMIVLLVRSSRHGLSVLKRLG